MAPKRRGRPAKGAAKSPKEAEKEEVVEEVQEVVEDAPPEVVEDGEEEEIDEEEENPTQKKAKTEEIKKGGAKRGAKAKPAPKKKGATKKPAAAPEPEEEEDEEDEVIEPISAPKSTSISKVIIIEASKECNSIKTRAAKVQTSLKEALPELEVLVNPDKPRKGCFEIRDKDGTVYLSLLNMPRPYTKLKSLDLDVTVEEIVAKIK